METMRSVFYLWSHDITFFDLDLNFSVYVCVCDLVVYKVNVFFVKLYVPAVI